MELKDTRRRSRTRRSWRLEASKILHPERTKIWEESHAFEGEKIHLSGSAVKKVPVAKARWTLFGAPKRPFRFELTGLAGARGQQRC